MLPPFEPTSQLDDGSHANTCKTGTTENALFSKIPKQRSLRRRHSDFVERVICDKCRTSFRRLDKLKNHMRRRHGDKIAKKDSANISPPSILKAYPGIENTVSLDSPLKRHLSGYAEAEDTGNQLMPSLTQPESVSPYDFQSHKSGGNIYFTGMDWEDPLDTISQKMWLGPLDSSAAPLTKSENEAETRDTLLQAIWPDDLTPSRQRTESQNEAELSVDGSSFDSGMDESDIMDVSIGILAPFREDLAQKLVSDYLGSISNFQHLEKGARDGCDNQTTHTGGRNSMRTPSTDSRHGRGESSGSGGKSNEDHEDDGDRRRKRRRKQISRSPLLRDLERTLACPYSKLNPRQHRDCFKFDKLWDISRLKMHLWRRHRLPFHCPICFHIFEEEDERDDHIRERQCEDRPRPEWDGITERQKKQLDQRMSAKKTKEDNWYAIWDILFPSRPRPKSPYLGTALSEDLLELQNFISTHGPQVVSELVTNSLPTDLHPQEDQVRSFLDVVFQDGVGILLERWEERLQVSERSEGSSALRDAECIDSPNVPIARSERELYNLEDFGFDSFLFDLNSDIGLHATEPQLVT